MQIIDRISWRAEGRILLPGQQIIWRKEEGGETYKKGEESSRSQQEKR